MSRQRVLFLCTGNSVRSQMAEAFLCKYARDIFEVHSAGLKPKGVGPLTVKVMNEVGIDISNQTAKGMAIFLGKTLFQYLITVCDDADKNLTFTWPGVNTRIHWPFEDPAKSEGTEAEKLVKFREVRDLIENKIRGWVAKQTFIDPQLIKVSMLTSKSRSF
ncbi:MAG: arsenate reductase ArsC [Chloroflexota bacterium]|nr:arsenate reductase ArsC [Chloroflexota bacterium]